MAIDTEPECYDEVKCKNNENCGTVIAKYLYRGEQCLDVRLNDEHVCYLTKAKNWSVIRTEAESNE